MPYAIVGERQQQMAGRSPTLAYGIVSQYCLAFDVLQMMLFARSVPEMYNRLIIAAGPRLRDRGESVAISDQRGEHHQLRAAASDPGLSDFAEKLPFHAFLSPAR